jgi:Flp pilus assembly protein TadD
MRANCLLLTLALALASAEAAAAPAAEIVALQGKGDFRDSGATDWRPAHVKQPLEAGQYVRTTQAESKMGLLLADQTQMTLQGVSIVQVKQPEAAGPRRSIIEFGKGTGRFQTKTPSKEFRVGTPTGLAAIRGTEWLVEVDDDGRSAFTVVEGELDISNELGSISVGADEQGVLERGKAPSKRRLQNARERVQWVSAFTIDPARYPSPAIESAAAAIGEGEISRARELLSAVIARDGSVPEAYFLAAEIELYFGRGREALALMDRAASRYPNEPRVPGLTARAALFADDFPRARAAAADALARFPDALESQLAAGEVARLDGDSVAARRALRRATRIAPRDWRAWHALGQVQAERAHPRAARRALGEADRLSPDNAHVLGELGLAEANAYDLPRARALLDRAQAAQPDDFATWTATGFARLKSGDTGGALEALLKATLLEPRNAKAHVYLAVAYWQLGRSDDAFAALRTASVHDPKDPLPYQFAAMMHSDLLRPGDALAAARESVARLAYVKSLDAIANDLRGAANLGAPLAQLGLEAWALRNAHDSFDPLWAASHLFLADRLPGKFLGNSELLQGFLSDPLAFGASNRFQSLVSRPGSYATLALRASQSSDVRVVEPLANVNGLLAEGQFAYFLEGSRLRTWLDDDSGHDRISSVTVGLGLKLRDDVGFFLYGNRIVPESRAGDGNRTFDPFTLVDGSARRIDAGMHYRPGPDMQLWIKGGSGYEDARLQGREVSASLLGQVFRESTFTTQPRRGDLGLRASVRREGGTECYVVVEGARWDSIDYLERDAVGRAGVAAARSVESVRQDIRDDSRSAAFGGRWPISRALTLEGEIDWTRYEKTDAIVVRRDYIGQVVELRDDHERSDWSPRVGVVARPLAGLTLRGAWQEWLRPASLSSLKPSSTAGIELDERYVLPGGRFERARIQLEWEARPALLVTAFADRQEIDNLRSALAGVLNSSPDTSNLERLRNRSFNALASVDVLEGFPVIARGDLHQYGAAVNALVGRSVSLFADGAWATSENTGEAWPGRQFPFLPKQRYSLGATYFSDQRWNVAAKWVRRGERFADEANQLRLAAEWSGAVQAYWETRDKRVSLELIVVNIGAKASDEAVGITVNLRF